MVGAQVCEARTAHQSQEQRPLSPVLGASSHKNHSLRIRHGEHHILHASGF